MARFSPTGRMLEARGLYRRWLAKHFSTVSLAGLAPDDEPILLRQIYVPLVLTPKRVSEYEREEAIHHGGRPIEDWLVETEPTEAAVGNLMRISGRLLQPEKKSKTFLISGEAGSGKTTLTFSLVDSLAGTAGDEFNRRFEGCVPFPILLREAPVDRIDSLRSLVVWWLKTVQEEEEKLIPGDLLPFLEAGQAVFLLDGLDEVGTLERRSKVLAWLMDPWTQSATPNIAIVTGRPSGFEGIEDDFLPPAWSLHVAPFSRDQIRQYLERWFELRPMMKRQREGTVEALLQRLTSPDQAQRLLPLARRPAYLASLAFVHGTRGELPYTRALSPIRLNSPHPRR